MNKTDLGIQSKIETMHVIFPADSGSNQVLLKKYPMSNIFDLSSNVNQRCKLINMTFFI